MTPELPSLDLSACDDEPIHLPGSIQPHGLLLVAAEEDSVVVQIAGDPQPFFGQSVEAVLGRPLGSLLGADRTRALAARLASSPEGSPTLLPSISVGAPGMEVDVIGHRRGALRVVELEPSSPAGSTERVLATMQAALSILEDTDSLPELYAATAREARRLTGFDRVMVYKFLDDGSGCVAGEDRDPELPPLLNHRYPASDIPRQARALYLRNAIRIIPDVNYRPAPLVPPLTPGSREPLDMSDCVLRSVSPIHVQYLKNMDVAASMSVSIVVDGRLWGLIACHHRTPHRVAYGIRAACRLLAQATAQKLHALEAAALYLERHRMHAGMERLLDGMAGKSSIVEELKSWVTGLVDVVPADGAAVVHMTSATTAGHVPPEAVIQRVADLVLTGDRTFCTEQLAAVVPDAEAHSAKASGALAIRISEADRLAILWFRAEQIETIKWAGDPHKPAEPGSEPGMLTPRRSFEIWKETVRGHSQPWTAAQVEIAGQLRTRLRDLRHRESIQSLNRALRDALGEKEALLEQKDLLLREIDHRVHNSMQLASSLLMLQTGNTQDASARAALEDARRQLSAVSLVHRRLYRSEEIGTVDLDRYLSDLCKDILSSLGPAWSQMLSLDLVPIRVTADRVVLVGLLLAELVTNAVKYAYAGGPGPIGIKLRRIDRQRATLTVWDRGRGMMQTPGAGFGSKLLGSLASQLGGELHAARTEPGTSVAVTFEIGPS